VAGHVLGFVDVDGMGQEGIELAQNKLLAGRPGSRRVIRDRLGRGIEGGEAVREPLNGNDIVLSIMHMSQSYPKILYVDVDIHHGDAVQRAFYEDSQVFTLSFHRFDPGVFFPADKDGDMACRGKGVGLGYNLNVPLPCHCSDEDFLDIFRYAMDKLLMVYDPKVVVMCVGTDGLSNDPLLTAQNDVGWNLTPDGIAETVRFASSSCIKSKRKLLLLGGGGYSPALSAKTYLLCTAAACEGVYPDFMAKVLPRDVPKHDFWDRYGPDFVLWDKKFIPIEPEDGNADEASSSWKGEKYIKMLEEARNAVDFTKEYIDCKENIGKRDFTSQEDEQGWEKDLFSKKVSGRKKRKRKGKQRVQSEIVKNELSLLA